MAEDTPREDENQDDDFGALTGGDSGLGNLPPLSDFDSGDDSGNLPPLGKLDSDSDAAISTPGDIPSAGQLKMDTPSSTPPTRASSPVTPGTPPTPADPGGLVTPEFSDAPAFDTPTSDLDTPEPAEGFGFQDLAADSDFSPETPEIGPGPDSDIDTPMFDSAFGGDTGEFGSSDPPIGQQRSAPTQAMETPMFDASPSPVGGGGDFGFDNDAFGGAPRTPMGGGMGMDIGTPIPDFSPDTGMPNQPTTGMTPQAAGGGARSRGLAGVLLTIGVPIAALLLGIIAGPYIANSVSALPNPFEAQLEERDREIEAQKGTIKRLTDATSDPGRPLVSAEELDRMITEFERVQSELNESNAELGRVLDQVQEAETTLTLIKNDIDQRNEEYVQAEELYEELQNNTEITRARHEGLLAENERLTEAVGQMEEANIRRQATKDALLHSLDRMIVDINQGMPLTPPRYAHSDRVAKAQDLRAELQSAKWVTPELMNKYTDLQLQQQGIASSREYFFAKVTVHNPLGTREQKWAECLMNGNWSVYYMTIDGQYVGSFENVSATSVPDYQFREDLPENLKAEIRAAIAAARVEGYEDKIAVLREKEKVYETDTDLQRSFSSL
jgi:hypothetical protein